MKHGWLVLVLLSAPAFGFSARLLEPQAVTPAAVASPALTPADPERPLWLYQAGAGVGAALISVPASLYFSAWLGTLTNNVYAALVPSLLVMAIVPSFAVAFVVTLVGNWASPGTYRFWPTFGVTALVNILALVVGGFAGLSVGVAARVVLFTIAEAIVLPSAATTASTLFARKKETIATAWLSRDPRAPVTWVIPTGEVHF